MIASKSPEGDDSFLYSIFDSMPAYVSIFDIPSSSVVYMNKRAEELIGYSFEELRSLGPEVMMKCVHPDDLDAYLAEARSFIEQNGDDIRTFDYRVIASDGSLLHLFGKRIVYKRDSKGNGMQILTMSDLA